MSVRIRLMTEDDLAAVAQLEKELFSDDWSEDSIRGLLPKNYTLCYVAEADGEIAGYFLGTQLFEDAEVYRVAVAPTYRRCGIGRALMEHFLAESKAGGAENWFLEVRSQNAAAKALYEGLGYAATSVRARYYHDPVDDALIMERHIGSSSRLSET